MLGSTATTTCDTCASGNALDEDLNLGDLNLSTIDREFSRDNDDTNSVCSSLSAGFTSSSGGGEWQSDKERSKLNIQNLIVFTVNSCYIL